VTQHLREKHQSREARFICISATTLERNRHGLFDREAPEEQQHHQSLVVPFRPSGPSLQFLRRGDQVRLRPSGPWHEAPSSIPEAQLGAASPLHTQLVWRARGPGKVPVVERTPVSASRASASRRVMWLGVGAHGHRVNEGELIKLGSFTLSVRQVCLEGPPQVPRFSSHRDPETAPVRSDQPSLDRDSASALCRICLGGPGGGTPGAAGGGGDEDGDEGPLILAPCLCRGNVQRVHLNCLRQWLRMRYSVENRLEQPGALALSFKPPGCEICKTEFPATFQAEDGEEPVPLLTSLPEVTPPFVVLSVPKGHGEDRERPHGERCVFAPGGTESVLRIGRQRGTELRLNDSSISRIHATLEFRDGAFLLRDNKARFRTLVLPTGPQLLDGRRPEPLSVQAGRTLLSFAFLEAQQEAAAGGGGDLAEAPGFGFGPDGVVVDGYGNAANVDPGQVSGEDEI